MFFAIDSRCYRFFLVLALSAPLLLGYQPVGDQLLLHDASTGTINAYSLTSGTTTTLATGVLNGASFPTGQVAAFDPQANRVTLLSRDSTGVLLTTVNLGTGVRNSARPNLPNLQALASGPGPSGTLYGLWEDAAQPGLLVVGSLNGQDGSHTVVARISTGDNTGGLTNNGFEVNADGTAFVAYEGLNGGVEGRWVASIDTQTGTVLGVAENLGELIRGNGRFEQESSQQLRVRINALPDASLGQVVLSDGFTAVPYFLNKGTGRVILLNIDTQFLQFTFYFKCRTKCRNDYDIT
mgnify:CR=1 FL=1